MDGKSRMERRGARRGGFSFGESLVVVAIIGVLVGLLLPAILGARDILAERISEDAAVRGALRTAMTEKGNFLEVVIGLDFTPEALAMFKDRSGWGQDVRLLAAPMTTREPELTIKSIRGGALVQQTPMR